MIADAPEVLYQAIQFFERWASIALVAFSYQAELFDYSDGIIEFLPRQRIAPRGPRNGEDIRHVGKIVAAGLRGDGFVEISRKRNQCLAGDAAAFDIAEIAVLDRLEDLRLCPQNSAFRFRNIAVDNRR